MVPHLDLSRVKRINSRSKKVKALDVEAQKIGVTRQSIIKVWVAERLKEEANQRAAG